MIRAALQRAGLGMVALSMVTGCARRRQPLRYPPVVVVGDYRLPGAVVRGATRQWWKLAVQPVRYGDPVPVSVSMYCLTGTTRRGRRAQTGIVAADPRYFPLAKYIDLYIGHRYLGRFLIDDTGKKIRGARIDVWTPSCRDARRFGLKRGTAALARRPKVVVQQAGEARAPK